MSSPPDHPGVSLIRRLTSRGGFVAFLLIAAIVGGGWMMQRGAKASAMTTRQAGRLFDSVREHILEDYVDTLTAAEVFRKAVDGVLYELSDPYTVFLPPERLGKFAENTTGNYGGLGLSVDIRDGWITVITPLPGSPADRAGLVTGDRIIAIDGAGTQGWTNQEVSKALRGPPGTIVELLVDRPGSIMPVQFSVKRTAIHTSAIQQSAMLDSTVGYIELKSFSDSTANELTRAVRRLRQSGMRTLVLDVRANPGGLLAQGVAVADLFLNPGQKIVSIRGRTPESTQDFTDGANQPWPEMPMVVLVDERSASASEIVAGALQDHDRAVLVGVPTYGKGSAQTVYTLGEAGALKLTTARWYTPLGRSINRSVVREESIDVLAGPTPRRKFRTQAGRTVYGGGGVTPDVIAGDTTTLPENIALASALGSKVPVFRDALASYALALRAAGSLVSPSFVVTPEMLNEAWRRMMERGIDIPRQVYDDAAPLVSRLLALEIARYVFGPQARFQRWAADDIGIKTALRLIHNVRTQHDLFARVPPAR